SKLLALPGFDMPPGKLNDIGCAIHLQKYLFKKREGFSFDDMLIPRRILETPAPGGTIDEEYIRQALAHIKNILENGNG
ncbi:MAG: aldehyde ferredoxin oxidoreductase C-terminal domain-containing protein, partial [Syntrophales bacterium LBB04]|nr:aldehyde ferredoxin oxidoreductase C-terminal domain-containing protein [Syntrophales bacterium LBB04]